MPTTLKTTTNQFSTGEMADENLANMLTLYKAPASIRDLKQVYFYVQASSNLTDQDPNEQMYGIDFGLGVDERARLRVQNPDYYSMLGTTKQINIGKIVPDLLDIRVPKDKYLLEINLTECTIEADTSNWKKVKDFALVPDPAGPDVFNEQLYRWKDEYSAKIPANQNAAPEVNIEYLNPNGFPSTPNPPAGTRVIQEATKLSTPQTLYCRIKEADNGEPYNWSVTNSGVYSIDKGHQVLVRHGDLDHSMLTLQFGHLLFTGRDDDYQQQKTRDLFTDPFEGAVKKPNVNINKYDQYQYIDYNTEQFNVCQDGEFFTNYSKVYINNDQVNRKAPTATSADRNANYGPAPDAVAAVVECNRYPYQEVAFDPVSGDALATPWRKQGRPLLYNQQASKINWRFQIRVIHLF